MTQLNPEFQTHLVTRFDTPFAFEKNGNQRLWFKRLRRQIRVPLIRLLYPLKNQPNLWWCSSDVLPKRCHVKSAEISEVSKLVNFSQIFFTGPEPFLVRPLLWNTCNDCDIARACVCCWSISRWRDMAVSRNIQKLHWTVHGCFRKIGVP